MVEGVQQGPVLVGTFFRTMSWSDRRKTLRPNFLSDATAKNSGEHTR